MRLPATAAMGLALVAAAPATAMELRTVTDLDEALWAQIYTLARWEADDLVADTTMFGRLGVSLDKELLTDLPYGPEVVMYFAGNGDLLAWSDKSPVVEKGYWEILDNGAFSEFCIRFGHFGLLSVCSSPETANARWITEGTPGNPFNLVAGAPVPGQLGKDPADLRAIAASLK